jgi:hypothetical protein
MVNRVGLFLLYSWAAVTIVMISIIVTTMVMDHLGGPYF